MFVIYKNNFIISTSTEGSLSVLAMDKSLSRQDFIFTTKLLRTAIKSLFLLCETVGNELIFQTNTTVIHFKLLQYCRSGTAANDCGALWNINWQGKSESHEQKPILTPLLLINSVQNIP
jgi:hypothetical protein